MKKKTIKLLPVGGLENPYQHLLLKSLNKSGLDVEYGVDTKFFPFLRTALTGADFIHVDWIHQYYMRKNYILTVLQLTLFYMDVITTKILFRVKLIWSIHNIFPHDSRQNFLLRLPRIIFGRVVFKVRVFNPGTVATVVERLRISVAKIVVIPEGNYLDYYPNTVDKERSRKLLNIRQDDKVMLFFGSIRPYKGLENLINSFSELNTSGWRLLIVGKAMNEQYLNLIASKINTDKIFLRNDFVPINDVQLYFNSSDVVVLPFEKIENSGSIKLAMGFGRPIVTKKTKVLSELMGEDENFLFDRKSDLKLALHRAMEMQDVDLNLIGKKNLKKVMRFNWNHTIDLFQ